MDKKKETMFIISWIIGLISMFSVIIHCWQTTSVEQPFLLLSKIAILFSIGLSLPYTWDLPLQRLRNIGNITLTLSCLMILTITYVIKYFSENQDK